MRPAYSVIFFTTASGAGYGLLTLIGIFNLLDWLPETRWFGLAGLGLALTLITAGLLSSTFHLGHPERAWRAMTQWRSSWLSREGVVSVLTYIPAMLWGFGWIVLEKHTGIWGFLGLLASLGAVLTVYCTAKIYKSLKAIPAWTDNKVMPSYLILGLGTGALLLDALLRSFDASSLLMTLLVILSLSLGWCLKFSYWRSLDGKVIESTMASATGLGKQVKALDPPNTGTTYVQEEMGYRIGRKHAYKLRHICAITLFVIPITLGLIAIAAPTVSPFLSFVSILSAVIGIVIERWLFFAQAMHVVSLYYGE